MPHHETGNVIIFAHATYYAPPYEASKREFHVGFGFCVFCPERTVAHQKEIEDTPYPGDETPVL